MTLKDWLQKQKITQSFFARMINSDQGHVSDLVTGKVRPKAASMDLIFYATNQQVTHADWAAPPPVKKAFRKPAVKTTKRAR